MYALCNAACVSSKKRPNLSLAWYHITLSITKLRFLKVTPLGYRRHNLKKITNIINVPSVCHKCNLVIFDISQVITQLPRAFFSKLHFIVLLLRMRYQILIGNCCHCSFRAIPHTTVVSSRRYDLKAPSATRAIRCRNVTYTDLAAIRSSMLYTILRRFIAWPNVCCASLQLIMWLVLIPTSPLGVAMHHGASLLESKDYSCMWYRWFAKAIQRSWLSLLHSLHWGAMRHS